MPKNSKKLHIYSKNHGESTENVSVEKKHNKNRFAKFKLK